MTIGAACCTCVPMRRKPSPWAAGRRRMRSSGQETAAGVDPVGSNCQRGGHPGFAGDAPSSPGDPLARDGRHAQPPHPRLRHGGLGGAAEYDCRRSPAARHEVGCDSRSLIGLRLWPGAWWASPLTCCQRPPCRGHSAAPLSAGPRPRPSSSRAFRDSPQSGHRYQETDRRREQKLGHRTFLLRCEWSRFPA